MWTSLKQKWSEATWRLLLRSLWNRQRSQKVINNRLHMAGSEFSEGILEGSRKKANQEISMLGLEAVEAEKNAEKEIMDNAGEKRKSGAQDKIQTTVPAHKNEGKSLVLLQVNCKNIYNKALEFWNLVDTYNPDIIIGTESWLREEIGNIEIFRADFMTCRRDRHAGVVGGLFVLKIILPAQSYGLMMKSR